MQISIVQKVNRQLSYARLLLEQKATADLAQENNALLSRALLQASVNALYLGLCCYLDELQSRLKAQGVMIQFSSGVEDHWPDFMGRLLYAANTFSVPELNEFQELSKNKASWLCGILAIHRNTGLIDRQTVNTVASESSGGQIALVNLEAEANTFYPDTTVTAAITAFTDIVQRHREALEYC